MQIFTGVTGMIICLFFLSVYLFDMGNNPTMLLIELVVNSIWWVFWLATAASLANLVDVNAYGGSDRLKTSCAFAWLTWGLWSASTFLSLGDVRNRRGGTMPAAPQANVGMV